jgi:hypothetical protein
MGIPAAQVPVKTVTAVVKCCIKAVAGDMAVPGALTVNKDTNG